jgi:hypothetical protein
MFHNVLENLTDQQCVFAARLIVFHDIAFRNVQQLLQNRHQPERALSSSSVVQTFSRLSLVRHFRRRKFFLEEAKVA